MKTTGHSLNGIGGVDDGYSQVKRRHVDRVRSLFIGSQHHTVYDRVADSIGIQR